MLQQETDTQHQEYPHHRQLHQHNRRVQVRRLLNPDDQNRRHNRDRKKCHQVEHARRMRQ